MNKTKNIHNNNQNQNQNKRKLFIASFAIAALALTLFVSPMLNVDDALATHNKKNKSKQSIDQSQSSNQNAGCVSGVTTFLSCNNLSFQHQKNTGNNALAQQNNGQGGNSAEQSISQSQSSSQNSQVVSGADTIGSGNNINVQSQENTGSNALAQS